MANVDDRIADLQNKLKIEKAKKSKIEARRRSAEAKKRRADDTRRKILIGAVILSRVESGNLPSERFNKMMDNYLIRDDDRALFGLPPKEVNPESKDE